MPYSPDDRPRLLPLEPRPVKLEDGEDAVALRDPQGVVDGVAVVSPAAYYILAQFDGRRTVREVGELLQRAGAKISLQDIADLADKLTQAGYLHGPAYQARRDQALATFRSAPVRPAICAGGAYPREKQELTRYLDDFFTRPGGPGPLAEPFPPSAVAGPNPVTASLSSRHDPMNPIRLLVAPHIDLHRGGVSYAHAYKALAHACDADLFVVFGTAHASPPRLFTVTDRDYDTPLGPVPTDRAVVAALCRELGDEEVRGDELVHRGEHSCEFQMVWLRHLFPLRPIQALPVLCSSISHLENPAAVTERFLGALARAVAGRKVCYLAGADLAHLGPRYGDPRPPTAGELQAFAEQDRRTLRCLESGDPSAFHRDAIVDDEKRRLCGVAPIYAAMRASGVATVRLLHYGQWSDGTDSVSYAACVG
jgi:AmmeMemoRadiSam system protein B